MDEFAKKSNEDLRKIIAEKREELRSFRFGEAGSRTRNVRAGRALRRDVARVLTELRRRELAEARKEA